MICGIRLRWKDSLMHQTTLLNYLKEEQPLTMSSTTMSMSKIWLVHKIILKGIVRLCYKHSGVVSVFFIDWSDFVCQAEKNAFVVADLGALMRQHVLWKATMPLVRPFYPVSCNSSPVVIEVLSALGVGFVCGNKVTIYLNLTSRGIRKISKCIFWRHTNL